MDQQDNVDLVVSFLVDHETFVFELYPETIFDCGTASNTGHAINKELKSDNTVVSHRFLVERGDRFSHYNFSSVAFDRVWFYANL